MAIESTIFSTLANFYYPRGSHYYLHNVLKPLQLGFLFGALSLGLASLPLEMITLNQQSPSGQREISSEDLSGIVALLQLLLLNAGYRRTTFLLHLLGVLIIEGDI